MKCRRVRRGGSEEKQREEKIRASDVESREEDDGNRESPAG